MKEFWGYHSEWNLGSPGGWDYQRVTQIIGKAVWAQLNQIQPIPIELDFDHPMLYPVHGFVNMLVETYRKREGNNPGLIAVVAEEETLEDVTENKNLAQHISAIEGLTGALMAPQSLELQNGRVSYQGQPVALIFMDFNTDVLLDLHHRHGLEPVLQAVREGRVINPRGTEPINVKSMFEVITGPQRHRFHAEIVERTPWTRQFYARQTEGPQGEPIDDLIAWTRANWENLVLKPERGYSGKGVRVGGGKTEADDAIALALEKGEYIVQEKIPLRRWAEEIPEVGAGKVELTCVQTDFRCLLGPNSMFGFLCRYGGVPTNVGSGGGVQPLAILNSSMHPREATQLINDAILDMDVDALAQVVATQQQMALDENFTYLLGPIKIALRPRLITLDQIGALQEYGAKLWADCLTLEQMWMAGELDHIIKIGDEELGIARWQPWHGSEAIIAADGLFSFGAEPETL